MKFMAILTACLALVLSASWAGALTTDEVIRLKKAGVSDATIQKMLEQEQAGGSDSAPVSEQEGSVVYRAGQNVQADAQRNAEHEAWKEEKSMDAVGGVIIDTRPQPGPLDE